MWQTRTSTPLPLVQRCCAPERTSAQNVLTVCLWCVLTSHFNQVALCQSASALPNEDGSEPLPDLEVGLPGSSLRKSTVSNKRFRATVPGSGEAVLLCVSRQLLPSYSSWQTSGFLRYLLNSKVIFPAGSLPGLLPPIHFMAQSCGL